MPEVTRRYFPKSRLPAVVSEAYGLSRPQGMGQYHFVPGPIPAETLAAIDENEAVFLDYVHGRALKISFLFDRERDQFYWPDNGTWFDHSAADREALLRAIGGEE